MFSASDALLGQLPPTAAGPFRFFARAGRDGRRGLHLCGGDDEVLCIRNFG